MSRLNPGRLLAAKVGAEVRIREVYTSEAIDKKLRTAKLVPEDAAFCRMLALGVSSTLGVLDETIDRALRSPDDINPDVRDCLRVSTYEILFLDKADHAAVDQGVELVRAIAPKAARLANAVLRKILAQKKFFPYANPATDDAALARVLGFPTWLAKLLIEWMGRGEARRFMEVSNQPAPVYFSVNAIQMPDEQVFLNSMARDGMQLAPTRISPGSDFIPGCYKAQHPIAVASSTAMKGFREGRLVVSDVAAQAIVQLALPKEKPESFLEIGAGRGTKTIMLQSEAFRRWGSQMNITCLDARDFKVDLLLDRAGEYGVEISQTVDADARFIPAPGTAPDALGEFDTVFIDAPCSGIGTLRRHPELRWRMSPKVIQQMASINTKILRASAPHVKVGGRLVYATCTVSPQENELALKAFLEMPEIAGKFRIEPCSVNELSRLFFKTRLTENGSDAHFAAVLRRVG